MKKILWLVVIILLSSILYFKFRSFQKYNPPSYFNYAVNDSIDINYYDQVIVQQYFENAYQVGSFARQLWFNEGVEVNFIDEEKGEYRNAYNYYKSLTTTTRFLEFKLIESHRLKSLGFTNTDIKRIVEDGINPEKVQEQKAIANLRALDKLKLGDKGQEVWLLQKQLIAKGFDIPKDGSYGNETQIAVMELQNRNDLYPSGAVDVATIKALIK